MVLCGAAGSFGIICWSSRRAARRREFGLEVLDFVLSRGQRRGQGRIGFAELGQFLLASLDLLLQLAAVLHGGSVLGEFFLQRRDQFARGLCRGVALLSELLHIGSGFVDAHFSQIAILHVNVLVLARYIAQLAS